MLTRLCSFVAGCVLIADGLAGVLVGVALWAVYELGRRAGKRELRRVESDAAALAVKRFLEEQDNRKAAAARQASHLRAQREVARWQ